MAKEGIIYPDLCYKIYGICFQTHNQLGRFRSEQSYADCLDVLLRAASIKYERQSSLLPAFQGESARRNIPDFIIEDKIILDVKAKLMITKEDYYQMKRYLKASNKKLGLIVNFRQVYLRPKRVAN